MPMLIKNSLQSPTNMPLCLRQTYLKDLVANFDLPVFLLCGILTDVVNVPEHTRQCKLLMALGEK